MSFRIVKLLLSAFSLCLLLSGINAQERTLGTWKAFMPYGTSTGVFDAGDKVYSIANESLFSYDKATGAIQLYDKVSGLSDISIKLANYDPQTKVLVVA